MNSNRRSFFKAMGAVAAASVAGEATTQKVFAGPTLPPDGRFFKTTRSVLEINTTPVGELESVKGGYPFGTVVSEPVTPDGVVPKHLGEIQYADLVMTAGTGFDPKFYQLLTDFVNRTPSVFNGAISYSDAKFREGGRLEFSDAVVSELQFPALNASANQQPAALTVICSLGASTRVKGDATKQPVPPKPGRAKTWFTSNFRMKIDGTGEAMDGLIAVKSLVFRQPILSHGAEAGVVQAGPLEVGDVVISVSELRSEPLYDWFAKTVENDGAVDERNGKLEFLATDLASVLFTVNFFNLGIHWLATEDGDESALRRVTAKMYCERASFSATAS